MNTIPNMKELLQDLTDTGIVRITGSYADGTQTENSDIDIHMQEDSGDTPMPERNMLKIINVFEKHNILWSSSFTGYISTINSNNPGLEIEIEVSDLFEHRQNRLKEVFIHSVKFKTW